MRIGLAGLLFGLALLQADSSRPTEPRLLDLTVIALDGHSRPVRDLTAEDFQVSDAGKPQRVAFFRRNTSDLRGPVGPFAPGEFSNRVHPKRPRATVILFDLLNESFSTRAIAANRIEHSLEPLESADSLYLYFLMLDGKILPVRSIPAAEGD